MYREVLAELARARGWAVHLYDAKDVEGQAGDVLGERADEVLRGPRATLGPPWARDHRMALAATVMAGYASPERDRPQGKRSRSIEPMVCGEHRPPGQASLRG
jgi:hypothetical protein